MQKIKVGKTVIVVLDDGTTLQKDDLTSRETEIVMNTSDVHKLMCIMRSSEEDALLIKRQTLLDLQNDVQESKILIKRTDAIYWPSVSPLSLPIELAEAIIAAEKNSDDLRIETYKNFWTLMSLNPDERCRLNLFWFLNKNGLVISRCGYFVAYRNADRTSEEGVYTDAHSHTFRIKIGEIVSMPRESCDACQDNTCSQGLHLGSSDWLTKGYYGNTGLVCLCNPADVVAVP